MSLLKLCAKCQAVIIAPARYCNKCEKIVEEQILERKKNWNRNYNKSRDKKYVNFYNSNEWKALREKYLQDHEYKCEKCKEKKKKNSRYIEKIATEAHHKEPIQTEEGWKKRFEYQGLEALCHDCHDEEHHRFQKRKKDLR